MHTSDEQAQPYRLVAGRLGGIRKFQVRFGIYYGYARVERAFLRLYLRIKALF